MDSPFVFIKCFTSMVDYLPMWQMYGDAAKGVCIVIDWSKVKGINLYKVCYLSHTQNGYKLKGNENTGVKAKEVMQLLRELKDTQAKLKNNDEKIIFDNIISPILYLFKDNSYSYVQSHKVLQVTGVQNCILKVFSRLSRDQLTSKPETEASMNEANCDAAKKGYKIPDYSHIGFIAKKYIINL